MHFSVFAGEQSSIEDYIRARIPFYQEAFPINGSSEGKKSRYIENVPFFRAFSISIEVCLSCECHIKGGITFADD